MDEFLNTYLLTILIFLPLVGALAVMLARGRDADPLDGTLGTTIVTFAVSLLLIRQLSTGRPAWL